MRDPMAGFTVEPGDRVVCGGYVGVPISRVVIHPAGSHDHSPIHNHMVAVEAITRFGSRWVGADDAWIGPDLKVHWLFSQDNLRPIRRAS